MMYCAPQTEGAAAALQAPEPDAPRGGELVAAGDARGRRPFFRCLS